MSRNPPFLPVDTASTSWVDSSGNSHIRVYTSDGYNINERCWDGGAWSTSSFNAEGSLVSATSWTDSAGIHIRVYCTGADVTAEWCLDQGGSWYQGQFSTT